MNTSPKILSNQFENIKKTNDSYFQKPLTLNIQLEENKGPKHHFIPKYLGVFLVTGVPNLRALRNISSVGENQL